MNVSPKHDDGTPIGGDITSNEFITPKTYPYVCTCAVGYILTAVPNEAAGYEFDRWTGDVASTDNTIVISVNDEAKSVTAVFVVKTQPVCDEF